MAWTAADIPAQQGRTAIVTGSNTGLGLETAAELARAGARVVLACRNPTRAEQARAEIVARHGSVDVELLELDLGNLAAIRDAAVETRERFPSVDLLINNAGVMIPPRTETADGFELQFGTNHLGHFAYTGQIMLSLLDTPNSRVVNVASIAHKGAKMRWDDLHWEQSYSRQASYGQSKLANLLFTFELDRRLSVANSNAICLAAHPGVSATELGRYVPGGSTAIVRRLMGMIINTAAEGALPTLRAATDPDVIGGQYWGVRGKREMVGPPTLVMPDANAVHEADWTRLWSVSEELTGVAFPV